jgi:trehalose 6-phosphate phosphatase
MLEAPRPAPPRLDVDRHALFLDLDGTLVEIQERPHAVKAGPELPPLLRALSASMSGAVAIVTGRTVVEADRIIDGALEHIAGVHGYELQRGAQLFRDETELSAITAASDDLRELIQHHALPALVEDKRASLALHYRHAPECGPPLIALAHDIAAKRGLRVLEGKMVVELVAGARTKGDALRAFMASAPFAGRDPIAVGDDTTDEAAFAASNDMAGASVLVGPVRPTLAQYGLMGPPDVLRWLQAALAR